MRIVPQAEELLNAATGFHDFRFTTYRHRMLKRFHTSRIVLMGDAAHAMSPHTGQGVNLALADAYVFSLVFKDSTDFPSACEQYSALRRHHVAYYLALTATLSPFFQSRGYIKGWGRDIALPLLQKIPLIRRLMVRSMAGLVAFPKLP